MALKCLKCGCIEFERHYSPSSAVGGDFNFDSFSYIFFDCGFVLSKKKSDGVLKGFIKCQGGGALNQIALLAEKDRLKAKRFGLGCR